MDFAKGEISFQCLRLIGSGAELGRLLIAAERPWFEQVLQPAISGRPSPGAKATERDSAEMGAPAGATRSEAEGD